MPRFCNSENYLSSDTLPTFYKSSHAGYYKSSPKQQHVEFQQEFNFSIKKLSRTSLFSKERRRSDGMYAEYRTTIWVCLDKVCPYLRSANVSFQSLHKKEKPSFHRLVSRKILKEVSRSVCDASAPAYLCAMKFFIISNLQRAGFLWKMLLRYSNFLFWYYRCEYHPFWIGPFVLSRLLVLLGFPVFCFYSNASSNMYFECRFWNYGESLQNF